MKNRIHIIIVAAGKGSRFGADMPKQFVSLGGRPVLMHTLSRLRKVFPDANFLLVLSKAFVEYWTELCGNQGIDSPRIVIGGDTRAESVNNAMSALRDSGIKDGDVLMVHDGARPVVPEDMLRRIYDAIDGGAEAAIPVIPVTDSLRLLGCEGGSEVADRSRLVAVQTPQAFRADVIATAYKETFSPTLTDDASVYQSFTGKAPMLVEGSPLNIKITNPRDIEVAALYMKLR